MRCGAQILQWRSTPLVSVQWNHDALHRRCALRHLETGISVQCRASVMFYRISSVTHYRTVVKHAGSLVVVLLPSLPETPLAHLAGLVGRGFYPFRPPSVVCKCKQCTMNQGRENGSFLRQVERRCPSSTGWPILSVHPPWLLAVPRHVSCFRVAGCQVWIP